MIKRFTLCVLVSLLIACSFFDSTDHVPMFLDIEESRFTTTPNQGSNSNKITDVSVFADGFSIGIFNIPNEVPVLDLDKDGISTINVFPVIRKNGIGNNPIQFPFYNSNEFEFMFQEEKLIPLDLEFTYADNIHFVIIENFEGSHIIKDGIDQDPSTVFIKSSEAKYGSFCGKMTTTIDNPVFEEATIFRYTRAEVGNSPIFLELDYKNNIPFRVGVLTYLGFAGDRDYKIVLTESEDWNKIYIELTDELGGQNYDEFQIVFGSASASDIGNVWIDNIKLIILK